MTQDMSSVDRAVLEQVGSLYDEYPYPNHRVISSVVARLLEETVRTLQRDAKRRSLRYVDAGCGTGENCLGVKRRFPELEVTGLDYTPASLAIARELSAKHKLAADFHHANLMASVAEFGPFDIISSIGVLHSLPNPAFGFAHLRELAHEKTVFLGMVYGTLGKWDLFQVRDALSHLCGPDASRAERLSVLKGAGIAVNTGPSHYAKVLKRRLRFGPRLSPMEAAKRVWRGRNAAYQADSYTHVQEETYLWSELIDLLEQTGWRFVGWPKKSGMPDDPAEVLRGTALAKARALPLREQAGIYERLVKPENLFFVAVPR